MTSRFVRLLLVSSLALFFELLLVRYLAIEIKFFTFFKNFVLMASFLGLGLGTGLTRVRVPLMDRFHGIAAVLIGVAIFAKELGVNSAFLPTGENSFLWYHPTGVGDWLTLVRVFVTCLGLTALIAVVFLPFGQALGRLLDELPPARSYAWDLGGSIAGCVAYSLTALLGWSPKLGLVIVLAATLLLVETLRARVVAAMIALVVAMGLAFTNTKPDAPQAAPLTAATGAAADLVAPEYWWSPYHRVHWSPYPVQTTHDGRRVVPAYFGYLNGHYYFDLIDFRLTDSGAEADVPLDRRELKRNEVSSVRNALLHYSVPYWFAPTPQEVLIIGAGPGNDAEVALRNGAARVTAVEIDPAVVRLGREVHPGKPYLDARVNVVIDDGRAFMARCACDGKFDIVSFGHLDSINLTSGFSSVRTDSYIYTVESMRAAFALVKPGGILTIGFTGLDWSIAKLHAVLVAATGITPYALSDRYMGTTTFIVRKAGGPAVDDEAKFHETVAKLRGAYVVFHGVDEEVALPTDDWPFLFLRERSLSPYHATALLLLLALAFLSTRAVFPRAHKDERFEWSPFWLGAGFMLIETKSITELGLLFGSTWFVAAIGIIGVLAINLLAVAVHRRWDPLSTRSGLLYGALFVTIALNLVIPLEVLLSLPLPLRLLAASLLVYSPLFFGGAAFVGAFARAKSPSHVFGANLLGAMVGGTLEYLSVILGFHALWLIGAVVYLLALAAAMRARPKRDGAS